MSLRTCRYETNGLCGMPQKEVEKLQAELATAKTEIEDLQRQLKAKDVTIKGLDRRHY